MRVQQCSIGSGSRGPSLFIGGVTKSCRTFYCSAPASSTPTALISLGRGLDYAIDHQQQQQQQHSSAPTIAAAAAPAPAPVSVLSALPRHHRQSHTLPPLRRTSYPTTTFPTFTQREANSLFATTRLRYKSARRIPVSRLYSSTANKHSANMEKKQWTGVGVRKTFFEFFEQRGHTIGTSHHHISRCWRPPPQHPAMHIPNIVVLNQVNLTLLTNGFLYSPIFVCRSP